MDSYGSRQTPIAREFLKANCRWALIDHLRMITKRYLKWLVSQYVSYDDEPLRAEDTNNYT